jgi:hypothetical protein
MSGHAENIGKIVEALAKMEPQKVARLVTQIDPAATFLFTPKLADGHRLHLCVDATDYAKIKRKVEWSAVVYDHGSGETYRVRGAACSLEGCFCDAIAERVAPREVSRNLAKTMN